MDSLHNDSKAELPSFDELVILARENPEKFQQLKASLCNDLISSASPRTQSQLRAQQTHIDRLISRGSNANHVNVLLYQELLKQLRRLNDSLHQTSKTATAKVLPFPTRDKVT